MYCEIYNKLRVFFFIICLPFTLLQNKNVTPKKIIRIYLNILKHM